MDTPQETEMRAMFDALDQDRDGRLDRDEVISGSALLGLTSEQAATLFDDLDTRHEGFLVPPPRRKLPWKHTVRGKCTNVALKMYVSVLVGALFFKLFSPEDENLQLTWVDAFYFATVTCTSVGYGDIIPTTNSGRIFMSVYMLVATVVVGQALSDIIDVYVNDVVGEGIVRTLINSTTWVHAADVNKTGKLTEADYVLFKLQQMMKVDAGMLDTLCDRFEELDLNANGWLDVGVDVPSAAQVREMQAAVKGTDKTLIEAWKEMQPGLRMAAQHKAEGAKVREDKAAAATANSAILESLRGKGAKSPAKAGKEPRRTSRDAPTRVSRLSREIESIPGEKITRVSREVLSDDGITRVPREASDLKARLAKKPRKPKTPKAGGRVENL